MTTVESLVKEIDKFVLKSSQKENWEIHSGDIVINKKVWRGIRKRIKDESQQS